MSDRLVSFALIALSALIFSGCGSNSTSSESTDVAVTVDPDALAQFEEVSQRLASLAYSPTVTMQDLSGQLLVQQPMQADKQRRLTTAQRAAFEGVDAEPKWSGTELVPSVALLTPGDSGTIQVYKVDVDDNRYARVAEGDLTLSVQIQHADGTLEARDDLVTWQRDGVLDYNVPADLVEGRLLIALRSPQQADYGSQVISERWSALFSGEVWGLQAGVIDLAATATVRFPDMGTGATSEFSAAEAIDTARSAFADGTGELLLPLVVNSTTPISVGDRVALEYQGMPLGGVVEQVTVRGDESLLLVSQQWDQIYAFPAFDVARMTEAGLLPEFVVYRVGNPTADSVASGRSDVPLVGALKIKLNDSVTCSGLSPNFAFTPVFDLTKGDVGIFVTAGGVGAEGKCTLTFDTNRIPGLKALKAVVSGPLSLLIGEVVPEPYGKIEVAMKFDKKGFLSITVGASTQQGSTVDYDLPAPTDYLVSLDGEPMEDEGSIVGTIGLKAGKKRLSEMGGVVGWTIKLLGLEDRPMGFEVDTHATLGTTLGLPNSAAVYQGQSDGAKVGVTATLSYEVTIADALRKLMEALLPTSTEYLSGKYELISFSTTATFGATAKDLGDGEGYVSNLVVDNVPNLIRVLLGGESEGLLGPENQESSLFNDPHGKVTYDMAECESEGGALSAPVIICSKALCGKSPPVTFCTDIALSFGSGGSSSSSGGGSSTGSGTGSTGSTGGSDESYYSDGGATGDSLATMVTATEGESGSESIRARIVVSGQGLAAEKSYSGRGDPVSWSVSGTVLETTEITAGANWRCESEGVQRGLNELQVGDDYASAENVLSCKCENKGSPGNPHGPPSDCDVWGEPHIITTDGLGYDFQAAGDYQVAGVTGRSDVAIQARFETSHYGVTATTKLAMRVGNDVVEIVPQYLGVAGAARQFGNFLGITVNGRELNPGSGVGAKRSEYRSPFSSPECNSRRDNALYRLPGGGLIIATKRAWWTLNQCNGYPIELTLVWPLETGESVGMTGGMDIAANPRHHWLDFSLMAAPSWRGNQVGLLGDGDGDPDNDLKLRDGSTLLAEGEVLTFGRLYAIFAYDWSVPLADCLFSDGCRPPSLPEAPLVLSREQRQLGESACSHVPSGFLFNACVLDVGLTGDTLLASEVFGGIDTDLTTLDIPTLVSNSGLYTLMVSPSTIVPADTPTTLDLTVHHHSGEAGYLLAVYPPEGGSALIDGVTGPHQVMLSGDQQHTLMIDCADQMGIGYLSLSAIDPVNGQPITGSTQLTELLCAPPKEEYKQQTLVTSGFHTLALDQDGRLWAWGNNSYGQLGLGDMVDRSWPTLVPTPASVDRFVQVVTSRNHSSFAQDSNGNWWAWGQNRKAELGLGYGNNNVLSPSPITTPEPNITFVHVVSGSYATLAIDQHGDLWGWGTDWVNLVLGDVWENMVDKYSPYHIVPVRVELPESIPKPYKLLGFYYAAVIQDADGALWGWGDGFDGIFGSVWSAESGYHVNPIKFKLPTSITSITDIEVGSNYVFLSDQDGQVWSWGGENCTEIPKENWGEPAVQVPTRQSSTLIASTIGSSRLWPLPLSGSSLPDDIPLVGENGVLYSYACGPNFDLVAEEGNLVPMLIAPLTLNKIATWIPNSKYARLVIDTEGQLWGWGTNGYGALGLGDTLPRETPVVIPFPEGVTRWLGYPLGSPTP